MILITNIIVHRKTLSTESNTKLFKTDKHVALFLYFSLINSFIYIFTKLCICLFTGMSLLIQDSETAESLGISSPKMDSVSHGVERPQASQENRRRASTGSSSVSETGSASEVDSGSRIQYSQPFSKSYGACRNSNAFAEISIRLEVSIRPLKRSDDLLKTASPHPPSPLSPQQKVATPIRIAYKLKTRWQFNGIPVVQETLCSGSLKFSAYLCFQWECQFPIINLRDSICLLGICSRLAKINPSAHARR